MIMLKRLVRYLVGHGRLVQVISEQRYVKAPRVEVQPRVSWKDLGQDEVDICIVLCFDCRNVLILVRYALEKREGEHNTADIGTKAVIAPVLMKHLNTLKMEWRDGRHPLALSAAI